MGESFPDWVLSGRFCDSCKSVEKLFRGVRSENWYQEVKKKGKSSGKQWLDVPWVNFSETTSKNRDRRLQLCKVYETKGDNSSLLRHAVNKSKMKKWHAVSN